MESEKILPLPDGKKLYYVHTTGDRPNDKVIVHIHGLSGWPYEVAQTSMARRFPAQGYDVVRPCLYHWEEGARILHETTIAINAADVEVLIDELQKTYKKIFVAGHSYGGPCVMMLNQERLAAASLWDPSYIPKVINDDPAWRAKIGDALLSKGSFWFLISQAMEDEAIEFDLEWSRQIAANWHKPLQVVQAAKGYWINHTKGESFHTHAAGPTDYRLIENTVHCFHEEGTTEQLLDAVKDWFDRF